MGERDRDGSVGIGVAEKNVLFSSCTKYIPSGNKAIRLLASFETLDTT